MAGIKDGIPTSDVVAALFQLAHDLKNVGGDGSDPRQLQNDLRSAGDTFEQLLIVMNNGCVPDANIVGPNG